MKKVKAKKKNSTNLSIDCAVSLELPRKFIVTGFNTEPEAVYLRFKLNFLLELSGLKSRYAELRISPFDDIAFYFYADDDIDPDSTIKLYKESPLKADAEYVEISKQDMKYRGKHLG